MEAQNSSLNFNNITWKDVHEGCESWLVWFVINLFSYLTLEARYLATPLLMVTEKVPLDHTVILSPYTLQDIEY